MMFDNIIKELEGFNNQISSFYYLFMNAFLVYIIIGIIIVSFVIVLKAYFEFRNREKELNKYYFKY